MKKLIYPLLLCMVLSLNNSCKMDNYEAPNVTLQGKITDTNGQGLQLEQGGSSARIKLEEISWSSSPTPLYLNFKVDGSYINSKLFAATYKITPVEGPFFQVAADTLKLTGSSTYDFSVVPYLDVTWVGDPIVTSDKKVAATFKFKRNAAPAGMSQPSLLDYQLFISTAQYVGNNNYDGSAVGPVVTVSNSMENQSINIISKTAMKYSTTYYVRIGVRVNDSFKKYNYTTIKTIVVP